MKQIAFTILLIIFAFACKKNDPDIPRDDNGTELEIQLDGSLQNPAFSPDGNSIVFTCFRKGYNKEPADMYTYNLQTKNLKTLVSDGSGNVNLPGSVWNDSIHSIVFSSSREPHDEIYLINETGTTGDEIRITNRTDHVAYEPSISPDGDWIVFESHKTDVEGDGIIMKFKTDGTSSYVQLTNTGEDCRQPNWSPAGDKILYQKYENKQWDIWTMNTDGSNKTKITSGEGDKTDACFSYDGQYIIFSTDFELDLANIYKIPASGGTAVRLSNYEGYDGAPSISPSGDQIIFESTYENPDKSEGTKLVILDIR